jgi:hypothetical protein
MGRIVFAGCASARFHRPHPIEDPDLMYEKSDFGLGVSPRAQKVIKSLRLVTDELDLVNTLPRPDLISSSMQKPKPICLLRKGQDMLSISQKGFCTQWQLPKGEWSTRWINVDQAEWGSPAQMSSDGKILLESPDKGHWIVLLGKP